MMNLPCLWWANHDDQIVYPRFFSDREMGPPAMLIQCANPAANLCARSSLCHAGKVFPPFLVPNRQCQMGHNILPHYCLTTIIILLNSNKSTQHIQLYNTRLAYEQSNKKETIISMACWFVSSQQNKTKILKLNTKKEVN